MTWNSDEKKGTVPKNNQTDYWRDLGDGGNQKPNETLTNKIHVSKFGSFTTSENCHHRTCVQRMRTKPKSPPVLTRIRNKPMSIMRSSPMSVTRTAIEAILVLSRLTRRQAFASIDHVERNYSCRVSRAVQNSQN